MSKFLARLMGKRVERHRSEGYRWNSVGTRYMSVPTKTTWVLNMYSREIWKIYLILNLKNNFCVVIKLAIRYRKDTKRYCLPAMDFNTNFGKIYWAESEIFWLVKWSRSQICNDTIDFTKKFLQKNNECSTRKFYTDRQFFWLMKGKDINRLQILESNSIWTWRERVYEKDCSI